MLEIQDLVTAYDGIRALRGVTLTVPAGAMVALIGPNGAGKSTLLNSVSGVVTPASGRIRFDGAEIAGLPAHRVARRGLLQVPEGRQILGPLSVEENLRLGRLAAGTRGTADIDEVYALFPILAERRRQEGGSLSGGQQQMLAIGRALMGRPRLLMLDEPSLGLSPLMAAQVFAALETLRRSGLTILLVEQNARRALDATGHAYVLEQGRIVHQGPSGALARDPAVVRHYLPGDDLPDV
ncbi:ABC transporter ATP-binding protein (plasmid) [Azospirillum baldaniorum]|uniref:Branched-chain amino acid ABC transporter (ATP binding protein) livF-like protein n=1 Tax=Azospirillum baldaniorum TaxID=1064539 RepID=A0A9P1JY83_9PROT|nr:ABC transporter ATP-binding protein [Azospirillum baldaniorum]AWJ93934.1 ABC transporter ATP-binding protein [Azospirillum baldaniorum]TWA81764.1 amino acid/amide ABC transporter ATP-binding protein 2 (HAAT family) [Azospirillum brasilense]CCD02111.1 putative Branched-chain amino acid ABC transporter (ATP binding protein); livF-like protein [Azospirillum baldaniorum]